MSQLMVIIISNVLFFMGTIVLLWSLKRFLEQRKK